MSHNVIVLIRKDPTATHQPVEGLRIALGLSTGPDPPAIILSGQARLLVTSEGLDTVIDADILENYIPAIQDLKVPIIVPHDTKDQFNLDSDFFITEKSPAEIHQLLLNSDRVLVF